MDKFNVKLENSVSRIIVGRSIAPGKLNINPENSLLVTDENLASIPEAADFISSCGSPVIVLPPGEASKHLASIEKIADAALSRGLDRQAVFIGLGGGVICDMTAFAASVYMRGAGVVLMPTTLLSMVDASIGGKTGVDFQEKKNLIGSFYPAGDVVINIEFLKSLSEPEFKSGLAEVIKHAFLTGDGLLEFIEAGKQQIMRRDTDVLEELVARSLRVKAGYIEKDFREQGIRAHLNLGHTFGHALETAAGLGSFTHGEAVAWGIHRAHRAGVKAGLTDAAYAERAEKVLRGFGYDLDFEDFDRAQFLNALSSDKKKKNGQIRFILQKNIGETVIEPLDNELIEEVI